MRLIHCTQKLLKELKVNDHATVTDIQPASGLGSWYANLLRINRRKCILFTNEKSIYAFLIPNVMKQNLMYFHDEFLKHLTKNLQFEGISLDAIHKIHQEYLNIAYAKTNSRKVLGFMNDFAMQYDIYINKAGGTENVPLLEVNSNINKIPCHASKRDGFFPIDVMRSMIAEL